MSELRRWLLRLRNAIRPARADAELDREVAAHLQLLEDDFRRRGLSPDDARVAARRALGGPEPAKRLQRDARSFVWLDDLRRDTSYAIRTLSRSPGFTAVAILTLALGTGASTAIFSVVDHVLLRALPIPAADRLVRLYESNPAAGWPREDAAPVHVTEWRRASTSFDLLVPIGGTSVTITGAAEPEALVGMIVGPEYFALTGITPALGRPFESAAYQSVANAKLGSFAINEPTPDNAEVIVSHAVWQRQFGSDPNVVGRAVELNGERAVVVGVMPADVRLDESQWGIADCWLPLVDSRMQTQRRFRQFPVIGRLKPGVRLEAAQAEMTAIANGLASEHPDERGWTVRLERLQDSLVTDTRMTLLILLGGVICVLLIAGANVANLLLMRAAGRSREVAVRMAIGAGKSRLVRQWITESTVLALAGGAAGFVLALWAVPALVAHSPIKLPRMDHITVDARIFAFSVGLSLLLGIACGLAPAAGAWRVTVASLRSSAPVGEAHGQRRLRVALVVAQIGLAILLLVGAGLMARSLLAVRGLDLGFDPHGVLTFGLNPRGDRDRFPTPDAMRMFSRDLLDRLRATPGVEAAGIGNVPLLGLMHIGYIPEGREQSIDAPGDLPSGGYFSALRLRLRYGRIFDDGDVGGKPPVAIVNLAYARAAWNTDNAVGRRLRVGSSPTTPWITVVGVVDDVRMASLEESAPPIVYAPYLQSTVGMSTNYVVRTSGNTDEMLRQVRDVVRSLDPILPITRIATMDERIGKLIAPREFNFWLVGVFSAIALILAVVGVYGLMSEAVASRTAEIGVRMALGAGRLQVVRLVASRMALVSAIGIAAGVGAAIVATRWLGSMLFGVKPIDPVTLALVPLVFLAAAVVATLAPARRATQVDPIVALRGE
jgi:putative ABC transport system permease protein